jgi:hypothetical protein
MENLWPEGLFAEKSDDQLDIEQLLISQAEGIRNRSGGLITGFVQDRSVSPGRAWALELYPANQPAKRTDLLVVRSEHGSYPVAVQTFDPNQREFRKALTGAALCDLLRTIFSSPQTRRILQLLAEEASAAGVFPQRNPPKRRKREARSLLIGKVVRTGQRHFSHVALAGVSGFVKAEDVQRLLLAPDVDGSPIQRLNDSFVVTISFMDSFKLTLTEDELHVLQSEAKKALA